MVGSCSPINRAPSKTWARAVGEQDADMVYKEFVTWLSFFRVQALVSKAEAAAETRQALGRLAGVEKFCNTLQQEMETYKTGIGEAQKTIQELENKLRNQRSSDISLDGEDIV